MKRKHTTLIAAALTLAITSSCSNSNSVTPAEKLISQIETGIQNKVVMFGHQDDPVYGHAWKYEANRSDVLETVGDYPAVMGWEIGGLELGDSESLDGVPFDLIRTEIAKQHARGGINTMSWHTYNPKGGDSWNEEAGVVTSISEGGENYDMFQERLGIVADYISTLKDSNGELIPIIFRPWHEHDGNWFWWGNKWCTHDEYRQLWDMTYKFMEDHGLNNIVWCYMPAPGDQVAKTPPCEQFDMVGFDEYQRKGDTEKYKADMIEKIDMLKEYSKKYNKPITISETGSESLTTENWYTKVLLPVIKDEPISYVLLWRNAWDKPEHFYCSYKGHSSEDDFRKFIESPTVITAKEVVKYTQK